MILLKENYLVPSYAAKLNIKTVVMKVKPQYQGCILFPRCGDFVFDEKATVCRLQPEADGKTTTTCWQIREWQVANTEVGKVNLVVTCVKEQQKQTNKQTINKKQNKQTKQKQKYIKESFEIHVSDYILSTFESG